MCLCSTVHQLAADFDSTRASRLAFDLNQHLADVHAILAKSKPLTREVGYQVIPNNKRTVKIISSRSVDVAGVNDINESFRGDISSFWSSDVSIPLEIRRRLACVVIFLRSKLDAQAWVSPDTAAVVQRSKNSELRYAGKKYIKIARKLGGIGSILWLPLDVPSSTYERYLNMDDEGVFNHLRSIGSEALNHDHLLQRIISVQLNDPILALSHRNLFVEYGDMFPKSDRVLLLISAFGGSHVPVDILKSVREPQKRWAPDGEIQSITAAESGIPSETVDILSDDDCLSEVSARPEISETVLEDGTITWSIHPDSIPSLSKGLSAETEETIAATALKLICFACPPCYEGKANWYPSHPHYLSLISNIHRSAQMKKASWDLLDKAIDQKKVPLHLKTQVIDALLFFSERGLFAIRSVAVERARVHLRRSMPYYYHASVTLFESIMYRLEGHLDRSDDKIQDFLSQNHQTTSRCDNALKGRLHISHLENKVQRYDKDVASSMYIWQGIHPLSTFEIEVSRRLQGLAAKFIHSIGDFQSARASLEQHLWLNSTQPIRPNTRLLIISRLSEIHCELQEYNEALNLLQPQLDGIADSQKKGRPVTRLNLISVDAYIGLGNLDAAKSRLERLAEIASPQLDDINDQMLHMRRLILVARIAHEQLDFENALQLWTSTLETMDKLSTFKKRHKWTAAVIHLSISHAQLALGDFEAGKQSWNMGVEISRTERYEYVIPVLVTGWLKKIVAAIHGEQGWPFRMMLPGGKPDIVWL